MAKDTLIDFADLNIVQAQPVDIPEAPLLPLKDDEMEKQSIIRALQSCGGVKTKAAQMLNVDSPTLYRKMKKYGINDDCGGNMNRISAKSCIFEP